MLQGHTVHVVGLGPHWGRELPGVVSSGFVKDGGEDVVEKDRERMKIAWRYEKMGDFVTGTSSARGGSSPILSVCRFCT